MRAIGQRGTLEGLKHSNERTRQGDRVHGKRRGLAYGVLSEIGTVRTTGASKCSCGGNWVNSEMSFRAQGLVEAAEA